MSNRIAIAEGLFTDGDAPCLIGGRDRETGRILFPCPSDATRFEAVTLPRNGTLWSWTVQRYRPKSPPYAGPEAFEPFAIGYVELPDAVIVEAPLTGVAFDAIAIGMPMQTVLKPLNSDAHGNTIMTFAFAPRDAEAVHE
ncbi:MAG: OB-fold domain-containing protein [Pseudomonadota bacterium]